MDNQNDQEIIYSLIVEDVQNVAQEILDRNLTEEEIAKIRDLIGEKINWFDAIAETVDENIKISD